MERVTAADVRRLAQDPSAQNLTETVAKLARQFADGELGAGEQQLSAEIFEILVREAEIQVRKTLSENLKTCPFLPRDVAVRLAEDIDEIALPILEFSEALADGDLVRIVQEGNAAKQVTVAKRPAVSELVSDALVDTGDQAVVGTLLENRGAQVAAESFTKIVDQFPDDEHIHHRMADRESLPISIIERMAATLSEAVRERLVAEHGLDKEVGDHLAEQGYKLIVADLVSTGADDGQVWNLACRLHEQGRLTSSLILHTLYGPDLRFFIACLARMVDMDVGHLAELVVRTGWYGARLFYKKAGLPPEHARAYRVGVELGMQVQRQQGPFDREAYLRQAIDRLSDAYETENDRPQEVGELLFDLRNVYRPLQQAQFGDIPIIPAA
jgi:uncharacterized protein (DUF2336 family)